MMYSGVSGHVFMTPEDRKTLKSRKKGMLTRAKNRAKRKKRKR
tara:strand:- start:7397 stop:7525 length:129 start_codon:yes stop_codon:yes gene_type:complete